MGRFINGDRTRTSPRSRLNNRISPARFDTPTPQNQQNGVQKASEVANDVDRTASQNEPNNKRKPPCKRRRLRRSRRKLVLMKSHPELKKRIRQKRILLSVPKSKPGKPGRKASKSNNFKKTKK
uniref:Myosin-1 n=1 Tax=Lygus hesperus TaxID=30085 RepID=A0A0A9XXT5_LYGHE